MRSKIFLSCFVIGLSVLLLAGVLFFFLQYSGYDTTAFSQLEETADYVQQGLSCGGMAYLDALRPQSRVVWLEPDGTVRYDSREGETRTYAACEEVQQALKAGSGRSITADAEGGKSLNYARLLDDGTILRLSRKKSTVGEALGVLLQPFFWVLLLVLVLSGILAFRLAKQIIRPINAIDLDDPQPGGYPELEPLIRRIEEQNQTIRRQMDELRRKQREFSAITENMSEGFLLIDRGCNVLSGNHSAQSLCGDVRNLHDGGAPEILEAADAALSGTRAERTLTAQDQTWQVIANPVCADGAVTGAVILIMDVTEREQREWLRREFSANVSHELKTPLTSISGFAELMMEGLVPPERAKEFSGDIYRESRRLISLVDDIIKLSKLDEDTAPLEKETVDLYDLAAEVLESLRPVAERQHVTLHLTGESAPMEGVWQILNEMVYNLCDNAIKYNRKGGSVTVCTAQTDTEVRLTVSDTGIGIPYAHQKRVFERFYRVDKSHSKEIGGTGLGLSIVKHGAAYHHGRVELMSEPDVGTTVRLLFEKGGQTHDHL